MTTRTRESGIPGKEKRGTSPSSVAAGATAQRRRSPVPSKTNSPARLDDSEKRVPNYLKPTQSSGPDVSKQQGKKPVSTSDSMQKPSLARRKSLDKPPSPSRTQKTLVSPNPIPRSSSSSGKAIARQKVGSDRSLKGSRDVGKQHTLHARPANTVKKGIAGIKKQETRSGGLSKTKEQMTSLPEKVHNVNVTNVPEPEMQSEEEELTKIEQIENINEEGAKDSGVDDQEQEGGAKNSGLDDQEQEEGAKDSGLEYQEQGEGTKDLVSEDQEQVNIEQTEAESDENESNTATFEPSTNSELQDTEIVAVDTFKVLEHDDDVSLGAKTEETEEKPEVEELEDVEEIEEAEEQSTNEVNNTNENAAQLVDVEEMKLEEEQQQEELNTNEEAYESEETEKQEVAVEQKVEEENEVQKTQVVENEAPRVQVVAHGKKDIAVSNDVIEETASKLREQRKNKVKALAGAFETVISLQESK